MNGDDVYYIRNFLTSHVAIMIVIYLSCPY